MIEFLLFLAVLSPLVVLHEFGHFIVAKMCGVRVQVFSLGLGPRLCGYKFRETDYRISPIPLGGYVRLYGESEDAEIPKKCEKYSFTHKKPWQKISIVLAGPAVNTIIGFLIYFFVFAGAGTIATPPVIGQIAEKTPAAEAGLLSGDRIISVDEKKIEKWSDITRIIILSGGRELKFQINRNGFEKTIQITPRLNKITDPSGKQVDLYTIGIIGTNKIIHKKGLGNALNGASKQTFETASLSLESLGALVSGKLPLNSLSGPVGIAQTAKTIFINGGYISLLMLTAYISIFLTVINLVPVPFVLDGGHALVYSLDWIAGKPVYRQLLYKIQTVGFYALMIFMFGIIGYELIMLFF